jgi:hypothetical protein
MAIGAAIGSAVIGAKASSKAAKASQQAASNQLALEKQMYDDTTERFKPFYDSGLKYQNALNFELGLGERPVFGGTAPEVVSFTDTPAYSEPPWASLFGRAENRPLNQEQYQNPAVTKYRVGDQIFSTQNAAQEYANANATGGTEYRGFETTPYQQYVLDETQSAVDGSAASRGALWSGATIKAQQDRASQLTGGFYQDYLNRLSQGAAGGQASAANLANASANYASGAGQAYGNIGNAQAAGAIGVGNALNAGINNGIGLWNYQRQTNGTSGGGLFGGLFSGPAPGSANSLAL